MLNSHIDFKVKNVMSRMYGISDIGCHIHSQMLDYYSDANLIFA